MEKIKNIIAATDFSINGNLAVRYAASLAEKVGANLTVFHGYTLSDTAHVPASTIGMGYTYGAPNPEKLETEVQEKFKKLKKEFLLDFNIPMDFSSKLGLVEDEMGKIVEEKQGDLLVLGAKGDKAIEKILGSTATDMIRKAAFPLLIIPDQVNYGKIEKIAFAFDNKEINHVESLKSLVNFAEILGASIEVLTVKESEIEISYGPNLEQILKPVEHHYHHVNNEDVEEGIEEFVQSQQIDWLAMLPRKHSLFEKIFKGSLTKKMVIHTHIPLFVFHE